MSHLVSPSESQLFRTEVEAILAQFQHVTFMKSGVAKNIIEMKALTQCQLDDGILDLTLTLPFVWQSAFLALQEQSDAALRKLTGVNSINWSICYSIPTFKRANTQPAISNVKNIIAVSSGKGGVGKSSTAVNLALALAKEGANVGILDADIYGPSIPLMLGTKEQQPTSPDGKRMTAIYAHGLATNSIGYLVDDNEAMVWRGPMASKALLQVLQDTLWPKLDYLVIDMPPGTGDIQLTLSQAIPVTASVLVTTPQDVALIDVEKGLTMFNNMNIPTLGVIENMSYHICENCGYHDAIFGENGAQRLAKEKNIQLLGQIPLHRSLRQDLDLGKPTVISQPDSEFTQLYRDLAARISAELYWQCTIISDDINIRMIS